jgi:hypothetical protein
MKDKPTTISYRINVERTELEDKLIKLRRFIEGDKYPDLDEHNRLLLLKQYTVMHEYLDILNERYIWAES